MAHTPPRGDKVGLNFEGLYTPPRGDKAELEFAPSTGPAGPSQYIFPVALPSTAAFGTPFASFVVRTISVAGINASAVGGHAAQLLTNYVLPTGVPAGAFGTAAVVNYHRWVYPSTVLVSDVYGTATVINRNRHIYPGGLPPLANRIPTTHWISYYTRYLDLTANQGIPVPANQVPTGHVIAHEIQYIDLAGRGPNPWVAGTPRIEFKLRTITVPFLSTMVFGNHNVARIQVVQPSGWESHFISSNHQLDINLQRLFHHSGVLDQAEYGATHVRNEHEYLRLTGWLDTNFNFPVVYNLDQYVFVSPYANTNSDPTIWPPWAPYVENQDRYLGPGGFMSSRFSILGNVIDNAADPLLPVGLDATLWGPETFIAYRNREVAGLGWDSFYNTQYTVIFNNARLVQPSGWVDSAFGRPDPVLNLNREMKHVFPYPGETVGTAFIAFRIRYLAPYLFYDTPSAYPEVRLNPYPIAPPSLPMPSNPTHTVFEFFQILSPKSTNVHSVQWVGEPIVTNRNRELRVSPTVQTLFGLHRVFNYNTEVTIGAGELFIWGWPHSISYRTKELRPQGIGLPPFTVLHQVRNELPDPPVRQLVFPASFNLGANGLAGEVPEPSVGWRTVRVFAISPGGIPAPTLTRNTIEPRPIYDPSTIGLPTLVFTQYFYPESLPSPQVPMPDGLPGYGGSSDRNWTKNDNRGYEWPRLSPHYILAPFGTDKTDQAVKNNPPFPEPIYHVMDGLTTVGFGETEVMHFHRRIGPVPRHGVTADRLDPSSFVSPDASLQLKQRWVFPVPLRSQRFGRPVFLNVPQYINFNPNHNGIAPYNRFGTHVVAEPPEFHRHRTWGGWNFLLWGTHRVELLNREVRPTGIPHRGNPQQNLTNPYGTPLVGFPRVYFWGGLVFTRWGVPWVTYKNRAFQFEGWNSLSLEDDWDLTPFRDRMRVRRINPLNSMQGIPPLNLFGATLVAEYTRAVLARGISGYNTGNHVVKAVATVSPAGWESLEVGDIDEWEAGKIKPHGDDLSTVGYPRLLHPLRPSGIEEGALGAVRVGNMVYLVGIPPIGFDGPSVTDEFGCSLRVVTPLPVLSQQHVSTPMVTA